MRFLSLVILSTMLLSGLLNAQQKRDRFEIALYAGAWWRGSEHSFFEEDNLSCGLGFTYRLSKRLGIEAELSYLPFSVDIELEELGVPPEVLSLIFQVDQIENYRLILDINGLIYILDRHKVKPFISLGFGWLNDFNHLAYHINLKPMLASGELPQIEKHDIKYRKNDLQFPNVGVGLNYFIKKDAFLRLKFVFHNPGGKEIQTTRLVVGFGFRF